MGAHIALSLNALGTEVLALRCDLAKLENEQAKFREKFVPIAKDISEFCGLDKWALNLTKEYGNVDGAVLSVENASKIFDVNYFGNLQILKGLLDSRAKSAPWLALCRLTLMQAKAQKGIADYSTSKAALVAAVRNIALEIAHVTA